MASIIDEFAYDVFLSFRGEDTRYGFTGNLKKALDDKGHVANLSGFHYKKGEMYEHEFIGKIVEEVLKKITVEDMGKDIVKQESLNPRGRSRLWDSKDINEVLKENKEASKIGIIYVNGCIEFNKDGKDFNKMENLKTLLIDYPGHFGGTLKHLPNSLRVLDCRVIFLPLSFFRNKKFQNMRVLNLDDPMLNLLHLPDLSNFPNLEELSIQNCCGKFTSDKSVGFLRNLKILRIISCSVIKSVPPLDCPSLIELDLSNCSSLESFPLTVNGFVGNLKILRLKKCSKIRIIPLNMLHSLEELNLNGCNSLESFSHVVGLGEKLKTMSIRSCYKLRSIPTLKVTSLEELDLSNCTSLQNFPSVVNGFLGNLKILRVDNCHNLMSIPPLKLDVLEELDLSNCYMVKRFLLSVGEFLGKVKTIRFAHCHNIKSIPPLKLDSLEKLDLSNCTSLESFSHVVGLGEKLKTMSVRSCFKLRSIPPLKLTSLEELDLSYCTSLESFPLVVDEFLGKLIILLVANCHNLKSIPPLKLDSLEKLDLSNCYRLESFPAVVDGFLPKLKTLRVTSCHNLRSIPPLKLNSLEELDLSFCYSLESFPSVVDWLLDKLKFLNIEHCIMLRSIPPLRLTLLEKFNLSYCLSLESFPEILGEITNIPRVLLYETPIKQLPFPFQHLTPPATSYPCRCGIVHLPNRVAAMSMLAEVTIKGEGKVSPMQSSHVEYICLMNCKLSDEYLSTSLMLFANVKELHLTNNQFTILPKSIEKCHFLWRLVLDDCEELQEIKGNPPSLRMLSALNCQSLTSSSKSKLLNQELHEVGNTWFRLPRAKIPEWFDHQCPEGLSISFWFRNKFPDIVLCVGSPFTWLPNHQHRVRVIINGNTFFYTHGLNIGSSLKKMYHLHLFHMKMENFNDNMDKALLENKWNHAEVDFGFAFQKSGIHVLKGKSNMKDIRFNDPENDVNIVLHLGC
ncbi:disease resistance protein RPV1 [Trifolium repens]|nr:disease resistance protein RPV1 [Trifolium repens]